MRPENTPELIERAKVYALEKPSVSYIQRKQMVRPVDVDVVPMIKCAACDGDGTDPDDEENCRICHGVGWVRAAGQAPRTTE